MKGERSTNCRVRSLSRSLTLARTRSLGSPSSARSSSSSRIVFSVASTALVSVIAPVPPGLDHLIGHHDALTAAISLTIESFASPNSIVVFGSRKSSLSMPAKPGAIERFITTTLAALSTSRIGIP